MASPHSSSSSSQVSTRTGTAGSGQNESTPRPPERSESAPLSLGQRADTGFSRFLHRRKTTHISLQDWDHHETPPYHDYIHQLVAAGWTNLRDLDNYKRKQWPDFYNEMDLKNFMKHTSRNGAKVRFYMAEYQGNPSPALIETLGSSLNLDPRFFQWIIHSRGHIFTPSQRHNAPYLALGFGVLQDSTSRMTDAEKFKVMVYIQVGSAHVPLQIREKFNHHLPG